MLSAYEMVEGFDDEHLQVVWRAIRGGGLREVDGHYEGGGLVNGVSCDEWMELVHSEMEARGFPTR